MNLRSRAQATARSLIGLGGGAARAIMHLVQKERLSLISAPHSTQNAGISHTVGFHGGQPPDEKPRGAVG